MRLETQRLLMRPLTATDWPMYQQLYSDPAAMAYVADEMNEADMRAKFDTRLQPWDKFKEHWLSLVIIEKSTGKPIGVTGFVAQWQPYQQAEVGFMLLPEFQGLGYAKESLLELVNFAFNECQFNKIKATVTEGNQASARLLEASGFSQEGILRENYQIAGQWKNDMMFGLLKREYN